jgi:hypothetical protein
VTDAALQQQSAWVGGLAEWTQGDTAFLSIAFTWKLNEARDRARWYRALGYKVHAGGPATFRPHGYLADCVDQLGGDIPRRDSLSQSSGHDCEPWLSGRLLVLHRAEDGRQDLHIASRLPGAPRALRQQSVGTHG